MYAGACDVWASRAVWGAAIELKAPEEYEDALLGGFVIADVEVRRQRIRKALDQVTRTVIPRDPYCAGARTMSWSIS